MSYSNEGHAIVRIEISGSGGGIAVVSNLTELQSTYPNGHTAPVWVTSENSWYYWSGAAPVPDTTPPTVTASVAAGTYSSAQSVTLSANETASIFYTTNGDTPTVNSTPYTGAITISTSTTLKFIGRDSAGNVSTPVSITYTISVADTTPPSPASNFAAGTPTSSTVPTTWTASPSGDVANYEAAYSLNGTDFTVANGNVSAAATSYTFSGLTDSTAYTFRLVAIDGSNNRSTVVTTTATTAAASEVVLAFDSFNRTDTTITSDSATTLGTSEIGGLTWTNSSVFWNYGVINGQAYQQRSNNGGIRYRSPVTVPISTNNFAAEITLATVDAAGTGFENLAVRKASNGDLLYVVRASTGKYVITKIPNGGSATNLRESNATAAQGDRIRVESYDNGRIKLFVNGAPDMDIIDPTGIEATTKVGFACNTNVSRFEDFKVVQLTPLSTDSTAPAEVSALTASGITSTQMNLSWTKSPSLDVKAYEVYDGATLKGTVSIAAAGSLGTNLLVTGLTALTSYTFTVKAIDWSGNASIGTNITRTTT